MTDTATPRDRGWWRTNAAALIALVVLVPGGVAAVAGDNLVSLATHQAVVRPAAVAPGQQRTYDDITIGTVSFTTLTGVEGAPTNGEVVVARVAIEHDGSSSTSDRVANVSCSIARLVSPSGEEWTPAGLGLEELTDDEYRYCAAVPRSTLVASFLVPAGLDGPFSVDLFVTRDSGTEVVRVTAD